MQRGKYVCISPLHCSIYCTAFVTRGRFQGLTDPQVDSKCFSTTM